MRAYAEFYCRQISAKLSLIFPLCITNLIRLLQTSLLLFLVPRLLNFVPPRKSTNKQTDVSVQPTGKWIERINQSERAFSWGYVIIQIIIIIISSSITLLCRLCLSGNVQKHNHKRPYDQHNHNHKKMIDHFLMIMIMSVTMTMLLFFIVGTRKS